jgi:Leucine-rich repeat (LRR) protein
LTKISVWVYWLSLVFLSPELTGQELLTLDQLDSVKVFESIEDAIKHPNEVYRLELKKNKLTEIPKEVFSFKNLQYLDLSRNKLDTFPPELGRMSQLQVLILNRNHINYLTDDIGGLVHLKQLRVSNNFLWEVSRKVSNLKELEVLDIWANRLIILPDEIQDMPKLKEIDMRVNPVKREVQEELQGYLPDCKMHFSYDCKCY